MGTIIISGIVGFIIGWLATSLHDTKLVMKYANITLRELNNEIDDKLN